MHSEFYKNIHKQKYLIALQDIISFNYEICTNEYCEIPIRKAVEYWGSFMNNLYPFCNIAIMQDYGEYNMITENMVFCLVKIQYYLIHFINFLFTESFQHLWSESVI